MKKILVCTLILMMTTSVVHAREDYKKDSLQHVNQASLEPQISALHAIAADLKSGKILYEKNADQRTAPASTTKMMTAIVAVENCQPDDIVTISKKAANMGGSAMGLYTGQKLTVRELLYGLLMCSGNDAAIALAEHVAGDVASFADLMNEKADRLSLRNTRFVNPHGLDTEGHYSTARELAMIGAHALSYEIIKEIVGTKFVHMAGKNMTNTNELLGFYEGVYGLKTGFTNKAGRCLVTSAKRGELDVITVVLSCPTKKARTISSIKVLDYVFATYDYIRLVDQGQRFASIDVKKGINPKVDIVSEQEVRMLLAKHNVANLKYSVVYPDVIKAPVEKGTQAGNLQITENGKVLLNIPLVTSEDIGVRDMKYYLKQIGESLIRMAS